MIGCAWVQCTLPYQKVGTHAGQRPLAISPISSASLYPCNYAPMIYTQPKPQMHLIGTETQRDPDRHGPCPHGSYGLVQR